MFLAFVFAQSAPAEAPDPAQIERIRNALTETHAITVAQPTRAEGLVFRMTVHGRKPERPLWDAWSATPSYVRPWLRSYHHEFLERVTPEKFRSRRCTQSGFPSCRIVDFLVKDIKTANRKKGEANAREEVRRALDELLACRANPDKPGC